VTMDDERTDSDDEQESSRPGRVRIFGAEVAGRTGEVPAVPGGVEPGPPSVEPEQASWTDPPAVPAGPAPAVGADDPLVTDQDRPAADHWPEPDRPHWTEAPTGEVPAVLSRDTGDAAGGTDPWAALPGPTWREEGADWTAHEETFEPSMLAHDEGRLGSLGDATNDRQPWTFELPLSGETTAVGGADEPPAVRVDDFDTMAVPVVQPSNDPVRPVDDGAPSTVAGSTVFPETGDAWAPAPAAVAAAGAEAGDRQPPVRRRGLGRSNRRRWRPEAAELEAQQFDDEQFDAPRLDARQSDARQSDEGGSTGDAPTADRTDDQVAAAAVAPEEPIGEPAPVRPPPAPASLGGTGRPVPKAPSGPRRPPPRQRPGMGLRPPEPPTETVSGRNLPIAIATGVVIGVIALVFFDLGTVTAAIISTVVVTLAAVEAYAAFRKAGQQPATLLGLVATISLMVATYNKGEAALPLVLVLLVVFVMLWHLAGVERGVEPVRSIASTLLVFCWVGVFGSFAALLLNPNLFPNRHGIAFLLGAVITAVAYDVAALAVGARFGRHPLSSASPNKTWEGFVGGAVAAILVAVIVVHFIHPWTVGKAACLGLVVAIVCPIGDLSESLIKRHLGLKDMGRILPGHGGILDRIDGLLFVLPATYFLVRAFHLG
jgi:phosphatidate cytidylyltransferase